MRNEHWCIREKWALQIWTMEHKGNDASQRILCSGQGMKRLNEFFALVMEDRASPQAAAMEGKLLEFCNSKRPRADGDGANVVAQGEAGAAARVLENLEPPVEAMWDIEEVLL